MSPNTRPDFEDAVTAELPVMYRVARRLALNVSDAEDLVGQVLLSAARSWLLFDGRHVRSWLLRILRNEFAMAMRRKAVRPQTVALDHAQESCEAPWAGLEVDETRSELLRELDRMPEEFRVAIALCDIEEMSYKEAAKAMDVPVGTVRSRLYRGRQMLRERMGVCP